MEKQKKTKRDKVDHTLGHMSRGHMKQENCTTQKYKKCEKSERKESKKKKREKTSQTQEKSKEKV